jgi:NADPH:quinone reductase-like Zn-dependent oxidoreductase
VKPDAVRCVVKTRSLRPAQLVSRRGLQRGEPLRSWQKRFGETFVKAIVYTRYGPPGVLRLEEMDKPMPKVDEVLIKVRATTVTAGDCRVRSLDVPAGFGLISRLVLGVFGPRQPILGTELAGEIEATGKDVTRFRVGDQIFASSGAGMGCYAEHKIMREDAAIVPKPANLSFEDAAAIPFGGATALAFFRRGNIRSGDKVLINGASGGVGTAAVQLAKHFGADVTGVCSTSNLDLVRSIGADSVIDYTREDFTEKDQTYDIILDTVGTVPFSRAKNSLKRGGRLLQVLAGLPDMLQIPWVRITSSKKVIAGTFAVRAEDLRLLAGLAEAGELRPVIDRRYPFEQMAEAHSYVDRGHKKGNVVVTLQHGDETGGHAAPGRTV